MPLFRMKRENDVVTTFVSVEEIVANAQGNLQTAHNFARLLSRHTRIIFREQFYQEDVLAGPYTKYRFGDSASVYFDDPAIVPPLCR